MIEPSRSRKETRGRRPRWASKLALAVVLVSVGGRLLVAHADDSQGYRTGADRQGPPPGKFELWLGLGADGLQATQVRGREDAVVDEVPEHAGPAIAGGVDYFLHPLLSVGVAARWGYWDESSIRSRSYRELLLAPRVVWPRQEGIFRLYARVPFGLVWPQKESGLERAAHEVWDGHAGFSMRATVGVEAWLKYVGVFGELGYYARFFSADVVQAAVADPLVRSADRLGYTLHGVCVTIGVSWGR